MKTLVYMLPHVLREGVFKNMPDIANFRALFAMYGDWVMPADRTGTIVMPINIKPLYPIPQFKTFSKSYEDICNERAQEILKRSDELAAPIYIMYSGGIDSTCVVVSILKHATEAQKKNLTILVSPASIKENPRFYDEHLKGKLRVESVMRFPERLGTNDMLVTGEHNDMILGSEKIGKFMNTFGADSIHKPYNRDMMVTLYGAMIENNTLLATRYIDMFESICRASPVAINTNMDFLWWVNFAIKWQSCYAYILLLTPSKNQPLITQNYLDTRFVSFYNTDAFQLWSMNNLDKRIKDTWKSYKWVPKQIIYEFNKDAEYRDHKIKRGSLNPMTASLMHNKFIDEQWKFYDQLQPSEYLNPYNDFC